MKNIIETKVDYLDMEVRITYKETSRPPMLMVEECHGLHYISSPDVDREVEKVELMLGDDVVDVTDTLKIIIEKTFF